MESQFLTNYSELKFIDKIKENLRRCKSFCFSVSFIKRAGLVLLYKDIESAIERGVKGKIITSTYQNFTDIESLKTFYLLMNKCDNFECHLDYDSFIDKEHGYSTFGYHSKGYLFEFDDHIELIVGSSNITRYALLKNIEWDLLIKDSSDSATYLDAKREFDNLWKQTHLLNNEIIGLYSNKLNFAIERWDMDYDLENHNIKPNYMQRKALKELNRYRAIGTNRALVVAAAGSGKTYLAAFDALNFNPNRLLYIVHEGSILKKSLETFQDVFGSGVSYGIYSGVSKELDSDFVFATNITMSKNLELFSKDEFDYIIIDECHHVTAETYKKIINYFEPEFLLGLTATPERMDNQDVFEMFDQNVPYELRLRDAIKNDLVVPFKYYGIRDTLIDYGLSKNEERKLIAQLANYDHCEFIYNNIEKRRTRGKLKAIAFCKNVTHARMMSEAMGEYYKTTYITGKNTVGERIKAYNNLQNDEAELQILFTVDVLNEGVDIPGVNMVLFLRPTESSTIFIQQLGRGLRKFPTKEYVTVLDFIGNSYKRSVQIAFALSSLAENFVLEKKLMMSLVANDFAALGLKDYGVEINIDDLSKEEITNYIENENFNSLTYIKQDYFNFKKYINIETYPKHMDYLNNDYAPDIIRFLNIKIGGKKNCSYYNFLRGVQEENLPEFSLEQINFINYLSKMLPLVRKHEYVIFKNVVNNINNIENIVENMLEEIPAITNLEIKHALKYMVKNGFVKQENDSLVLNVQMDNEFEEYLDDLINYGLTRYSSEYGNSSDFKLWGAYRKDQALLKKCQHPEHTHIGTYVLDDIIFLFVNLKKELSLLEHLQYKDKFIEKNVFQWECQAGESENKIKQLLTIKKVMLFVRKTESENGITLPFTYVGTGELTNPRQTDNKRGSLLFDIMMDNELPDYLQYDFGLTK